MDELIIVMTTVDSKEAGMTIADAVLNKRYGACVQIVGPMQSRFWWQGKIDSATEYQCVIKTSRSHYDLVEATILQHHPYQCPEILAIPVIAGYVGYLDWLRSELGAAEDNDNG